MTRTTRNWPLMAICMLVMLLCGCGDDNEGQQSPSQEQSATQGGAERPAPSSAQPQAPTGVEATEGGMPAAAETSKTAEENRQAPAQMNQGKQIQAVAANTLKDLLPASLSGMERTDASAERSRMMGVDMTIANATYEASNEGPISITITDAGNMSGPMRMGLAAWAATEYSRETKTGYEKTSTYGGFKAVEEYDKQNQYGAIRVFVADRFVVEVEGNNVTMDAIQQALSKVDLTKMAGLGSGS